MDGNAASEQIRTRKSTTEENFERGTKDSGKLKNEEGWDKMKNNNKGESDNNA